MKYEKFLAANTESKEIGLSILRLFASLIPAITLATNMAMVVILALGGHFVIVGGMTSGQFTAFNSYLAILIFPIILIGFMSNVIAQAGASYTRIGTILGAPEEPKSGRPVSDFAGRCRDERHRSGLRRQISAEGRFVRRARGDARRPSSGPRRRGKRSFCICLIGLLKPTSGTIAYDGEPIDGYEKESLHRHVGFVFQDSVMFNLTLRENIAFSNTADDKDIEKAINTAELNDFLAALPQGLDTVGLRARHQPFRWTEAACHAGASAGA